MASKKHSERTVSGAGLIKDAERDLEAYRDIADDVIESDFVPYACLYDPDTILAKDGELLQTIKITGADCERDEARGLRKAIRQAIRQSIPDGTYAIWLHTLRRKQTQGSGAQFPDPFSAQLDQSWASEQLASVSFVNELYVTIVKGSETAPKATLKNCLRANRDQNPWTADIDVRAKKLHTTTQSMLKLLAPFGAQALTIVERDGVFYSEQLEFLEKLINLEARPMEVPMRDLSHVLTSGEITFGYNAMEVRTFDGHRRFAAILTLKEYKESTLPGIDRFLEVPCEIIVSQCFAFTNAEKAKEAYAKQGRYLGISGDKQLAEWIEIDRLMYGQASNSAKEFGQQQTSLFLISPSVRELEANVKMVQRSLGRLGMVVVREDLRFEDSYWAQLPGNFPFLKRQHPIDTEHLAGFSNLQTAPMGTYKGSPWGPPVSIFSTLQDAPYYFNYHRGAAAHTIILGKPGSGRTSFAHFLMAQTRKLPVDIWYIDCHGRSAALMQAMNGRHHTPGAGLGLNPFQLPETPANREFLALWLSTLIDPEGTQLNRATLAFFQSVIDGILALPRAQRRLSTLFPVLQQADPLMAGKLQKFVAGQEYGALFDAPEDQFATGTLSCWDISRWYGDARTRIPLVSYLLHQLTARLNGKPTLIVLDEGFHQLGVPLYAARAAAWCDYLTANNAAALLMTDDIASSGSYGFSRSVADRAATLFAMGDAEPDAEYAMGFGLRDMDMAALVHLDSARHHILQKRGDEAVVLKVNFDRLGSPTRTALSGRTMAAPAAALSPEAQLAALMGMPHEAV